MVYAKMMVTRIAAALIAISLVGCRSDAVAPSAAGTLPPDRASVMSAGDLRKLYADNTWFWPDGAAFFAESGRFRAWSGSGQKASYALGMWWVNDHGSLCFDASWHSKDGAKESTTCFTHRQSGDVLYQKREPSGAWYVFRSNPVKLEDEIKKLKSGDLVEVKVQAVQAQLGTATP